MRSIIHAYSPFSYPSRISAFSLCERLYSSTAPASTEPTHINYVKKRKGKKLVNLWRIQKAFCAPLSGSALFSASFAWINYIQFNNLIIKKTYTLDFIVFPFGFVRVPTRFYSRESCTLSPAWIPFRVGPFSHLHQTTTAKMLLRASDGVVYVGAFVIALPLFGSRIVENAKGCTRGTRLT